MKNIIGCNLLAIHQQSPLTDIQVIQFPITVMLVFLIPIRDIDYLYSWLFQILLNLILLWPSVSPFEIDHIQ